MRAKRGVVASASRGNTGREREPPYVHERRRAIPGGEGDPAHQRPKRLPSPRTHHRGGVRGEAPPLRASRKACAPSGPRYMGCPSLFLDTGPPCSRMYLCARPLWLHSPCDRIPSILDGVVGAARKVFDHLRPPVAQRNTGVGQEPGEGGAGGGQAPGEWGAGGRRGARGWQAAAVWIAGGGRGGARSVCARARVCVQAPICVEAS